MNRIESTDPDPRPPLILVIPDALLDEMPTLLPWIVTGCEAAYHAGRWYVTVPAEKWLRMPPEVQARVQS